MVIYIETRVQLTGQDMKKIKLSSYAGQRMFSVYMQCQNMTYPYASHSVQSISEQSTKRGEGNQGVDLGACLGTFSFEDTLKI